MQTMLCQRTQKRLEIKILTIVYTYKETQFVNNLYWQRDENAAG